MDMKHKIVTGICVLSVFGLGVASNQVWHTAQVKSAVRAQVLQVQQEVAQEKARQLKVAEDARLKRLSDQCAKDHTAYAALTPVQRTTKNAVTDCNPNLPTVQ